MCEEIVKAFKIPISSSPLYRPLALGITLLVLQCIGGEAYIGKNMIQILNSGGKSEKCFETAVNLTQSMYSEKGNQLLSNTCLDSHSSTLKLSLLIQSVKLAVITTMTFLIRKLRVRFLYFVSLILTVLIFLCLGFISDNSLSLVFFNHYSIRIIKTVLLCLHIIFLQFGIQTLPSFLMDVLYPTSYRAMLKGYSISIGNAFLIILIIALKMFSFSQSFWVLSSIIFISIPFLYVFLPEIRNIGTVMSADYFIPFQTVFYFPLSNDISSNSSTKDLSNIQSEGENDKNHSLQSDYAKNNPKVFFNEEIPCIEDIEKHREYEILNTQRVNFVSNILGQSGFLTKNKNKSRVLLGRGIVKFRTSKMMSKGSIFLFSDVLIVARCVLAGRRYVAEISFKLNSPSFSMELDGTTITFMEKINCVKTVDFEDSCLSKSWERFIQFARSKNSIIPPITGIMFIPSTIMQSTIL